MTKADLEYFPHVVDRIWDFLPASSAYLAGQVCFSWRQRALKVIYRHLAVEPCDAGWRFWMRSEPPDIYVKYLLSKDDLLSRHLATQNRSKPTPEPALDLSAARHTEVLDALCSWEPGSPASPLRAIGRFPGLHTMRVHIDSDGRAEGAGATQVFFWFSGDAFQISVAAHGAHTLVLAVIPEVSMVYNAVFDGNIRLAEQLAPASYGAAELVLVFLEGEAQYSIKEVARDLALYLGTSWEMFRITVVGAETLVVGEGGEE